MMSQSDGQFGRRSYLKTTGLATAGMIGLAGCTGDGDLDDDTNGTNENGGSETGLLSTSVTDQPNDIGDFESLTVTIDGIWIKPANSDAESDESDETDDADDSESESDDTNGNDNGDDSDEDDVDDDDIDDDNIDDGDDVDEGQGRRYIEFDEPQEADLVQLQGDNSQLIDETEVDVGTYQFLQLNVSNTVGILADDGSEADVETPGNAPLQFKSEFEIRAGERTRFIADFAPNRRGRQNSYIIRPVATGTKVLYGDEEYTADDDDNEEGDETEVETEADDSTDDSPNGEANDPASGNNGN